MTLAFIFVGWIFSLCLHEFAHAAVAYTAGDYTVKEKGYLSLNPLKFADPVLSVIIPLVILLIGGIGLPGGAVYLERRLIPGPMWNCLVSLAGPAANALFALVLSIPFVFGMIDPGSANPAVHAYACLIVLQICAVLLNLLPIPPLDGFQALASFVSEVFRARALQYGNYGFFIIIVLFWMVPPFRDGFWNLVFFLSNLLGVPRELALMGLRELPSL